MNEISLKHSAITEQIIGVFYDVYNELGEGFLESVYHNAMSLALEQVGLQVAREVSLPVFFRGEMVGDFRADLIVNGLVIVELKSARTIESSHEAQIYNYLRSTEIEVGLLLNFGPRAQFRRVAFENVRKKSSKAQAVGK